MGRGTILADLGEGQYSIKLDFGESRLAAQLLLLTGANSDLDAQIAAQQAKVNAAQAALDASNAALAAAINAYVAGNSSPNLLPPIEAAKLDQVAKEEALRRETVALGKLQSSKANNLRKIDDLNSYRASLTLNAWCADYTEGASGEVATLEIPNEPATVLIAPAGRAPVDADGKLRMRALMTAPQAYYNAAILPGWQKFKPTYRSGTITAINGDTADVALDEAKSSAGGIADIGLANIEFNVNQTSTLTNVPIVYQDCNGTAFEVGDAVVVQFMSQSWSTPQIIGFLSNPKECGVNFTIFYTKRNTGIGISPGNTVLNADKKYNQTTGAFTSYSNVDTTRTSTSFLPWSDFRAYGQTGEIYYTLSSYLPNILEDPNTIQGGVLNQKSDGTARWRGAIIGGPSGSSQFSLLGWLVGFALKKVDTDWYIFAVERFGTGAPNFPGYNAQRMLRSKLYTNGGIVSWEVVHEFVFTELSVLGRPLRNAGDICAPVNFNSTCTEAVSLLSDLNVTSLSHDNTGLIYTISGINVTAIKTQLAPLSKSGTADSPSGYVVSGNLVIGADYDNNDNLKLLKLSIESVYKDTGIGDESLNIGASTLETGWSSVNFPARSFSINPSTGDKITSNAAYLFFHFWDPKHQIIIYSNIGIDWAFISGSGSRNRNSAGEYYVNGSKTYDYPFTSTLVSSSDISPGRLQVIRSMTSPNQSDNFARALDKYHLMSRPMVKIDGVVFIENILNSFMYFNDDSEYHAINNDSLSMSTIRSAFGGSMVSSPAGDFNQNHSIRVRFW